MDSVPQLQPDLLSLFYKSDFLAIHTFLQQFNANLTLKYMVTLYNKVHLLNISSCIN